MKKKFWSAGLGNLFEHYDAAIFGFLSPFLAPLIFPTKGSVTALILTYSMIPLGMIVRPIGSLVFGYIGDLYGRSYALFLTLAGMGIVSIAIGCSPIYFQGGVLVPILFSLGRILQNFFASGETMGGAIYLLENMNEKRHDLVSGFYSASTVAGILLASFGVSLLSWCDAINTHWRALYFVGGITALFGCILRWQTAQYIGPSISQITFRKKAKELCTVFFMHRKKFLLISLVSGLGYANYVISLVLMNGFIPLISSYSKSEILSLNSSLLILDLCALPIFGFLASKISREKIMLGAAICIFLGAIPAFYLLENASFPMVIAVRICLVLLGVAFFAPFHSWAQQLVPPEHRYTIISFSYALGSQLLGGPTAALSLWLFRETSMVTSVAWYWMTLAFLSSMAIIVSKTEKSKAVQAAL